MKFPLLPSLVRNDNHSPRDRGRISPAILLRSSGYLDRLLLPQLNSLFQLCRVRREVFSELIISFGSWLAETDVVTSFSMFSAGSNTVVTAPTSTTAGYRLLQILPRTVPPATTEVGVKHWLQDAARSFLQD